MELITISLIMILIVMIIQKLRMIRKLKVDICKDERKMKEDLLYPCKSCLMYNSGCEKLCSLLERDEYVLREKITNHMCCPDCGSLFVPVMRRGPGTIDVKCEDCGHYFHINGFRFEQPTRVERMFLGLKCSKMSL